MKIAMVIPFFLVCIFSFCCSNGQGNTKTVLEPKEFAEKIKNTPSAQVIDVRTPREFADGHLLQAVNMDWENEEFYIQVKSLDKSKPVFVYCQGGGRSEDAAKAMRKEGFVEVYELSDGFSAWRSAKLPETKQ
jgi:rhodanese-related sulfurtransferase